MKRFWIISTLAMLAAMVFGSLLHRLGQESSVSVPEARGENRLPSFVAESPYTVPDSEMPFDDPLMPELLPESKRSQPEVKFTPIPVSTDEPSSPKIEVSGKDRSKVDTPAKLVTTVNLAKPVVPTEVAPVIEEEVKVVPADPVSEDGRFLPIVLYLGREEGKLVLQGSIPTREATDAVIAAAVKLVGEDSVENHLKYSPETIDADWFDELPGYIETFFGHSAGNQELIVVDGVLKLRGDVPSENSRSGLIAMADSFKEGGLKLDPELEVKASLAGSLPELPVTLAAGVEASPESKPSESEAPVELAMVEITAGVTNGEDAKSRSATIAAEEAEVKSDDEAGASSEIESAPVKAFLGPAESPQEWAAAKAVEKAAAKAKAEQDAAVLAAAEKKKAELELAAAAAKEAELAAAMEAGENIPDDGKPLIFYFEEDSAEIIASHREKIALAIQRAKVPRSIVYITAYADYRGGYEVNRQRSLDRAETVRGLIFAGDIADEVTAEISAKGESKSSKLKTDEALKRSRRVVVEVYHLKR